MGTDEIAVEGIRSKLLERIVLHRCDYATYTAYPYIALVQRDKSDGKLKAKDIYTGTSFLSKRFTRLVDPASKTNPRLAFQNISSCRLMREKVFILL